VATQSLPHERAQTWFGALRGSLFTIRVPIAMAALTVVVLTLSEQVQEVYRILVQERPTELNFQYHWLFAVLALVALSLVLWQVARGLSYDYELGGDLPHPVARLVLRWGPRLLATTPLLGAALGVWLCRITDLSGSNEPLLAAFVQSVARLQRGFDLAAAVCAGLAIVIFLFIWVFERKMIERDQTRRVARSSNWFVFPIVAAVSIAWIALEPVGRSQFFGVVPIFALWMVALALLVALLARFTILAIPALGLLVAYVVAIEVLKLADNHEIRYQDRAVERRAVDEAFDDWLASRKDRAAYEAAGKPYPVYIVASEGGGLYAAYQTAQFLTRMQDLCPGFAQHLFAVSSVSGGSLGAGVFAGLMATQPKSAGTAPCKAATAGGPGPLETEARTILSSDFLAPAVWGALFPDFLQRFIPKSLPALDRALLLEAAFERAWIAPSAANPPVNPPINPPINPMARGLFDLCGKAMGECLAGSTPLLAFNVTNVETGLQMVLSPLDLTPVGSNVDPSQPTSRKVYDFFGVAGIEPFSVQLSTAVGLSARFPWLSPPGWFTYDPPLSEESMQKRYRARRAKSGKTRLTFIDGGFVDNSGVATALNIAQFLDARVPRPKVDFRVIMISALWAPLDRLQIDPPLDRNSGELQPPIDAEINSRQGRGYKTQFDAALEAKPGLNVSEIGFYYGYLELPLGWQLSDVSRRYLQLFRGEPGRCLAVGPDGYADYIARSTESHHKAAAAYMRRSDCLVAKLRNELTPTEPPLDIPVINPAN
jgi:hypothetical protein